MKNSLTQVQKANAEKDVMFRQNLRLEMELKQAKELAGSFEDKFTRCINLTKNMLIEKCNHEKREARRKSMEDRIRLGEWSSSYSVSSRDSVSSEKCSKNSKFLSFYKKWSRPGVGKMWLVTSHVASSAAS